jgi:bacterial/archaeal transporter family-2 protein
VARHPGRRLTSTAVALTVLAGLAGSVQVAVMGRFGERIGIAEALTFSTAIQLVLSLTILLAARSGLGGLGGAFSSPAWMWLGGVMGLTVVFTITFAQPRIGATATIGILIAGQLVMGALIDRFGLFGVEQIAISPARLAGIALLGIGAALSLVR